MIDLGAGEAVASHDRAGDAHDRHLVDGKLREGVVFLHHLPVALEILGEGSRAANGRKKAYACDEPGDPRTPTAPAAGLFEDHTGRRLLLVKRHHLATEGKLR